MKKTKVYKPPGLRVVVWNDGVKMTWKSDGKLHTRAELLRSWGKIDKAARRILDDGPETV